MCHEIHLVIRRIVSVTGVITATEAATPHSASGTVSPTHAAASGQNRPSITPEKARPATRAASFGPVDEERYSAYV